MIQLHCDARALAVEFRRGGQPDPAVAAGDRDMLVRSSAHGRHSLRWNMSVSATFPRNVAAAVSQLRETRVVLRACSTASFAALPTAIARPTPSVPILAGKWRR